jgi:3-deoxy-7-phosphoheptulonate synthase
MAAVTFVTVCVAHKLLLALAEAGMPTANEALDPIMPQYLADLIA